MSCILLNYKKQSLANLLVQFGRVGHQAPKSKVNGPMVHFPYKGIFYRFVLFHLNCLAVMFVWLLLFGCFVHV